jgi:hypothetical protein
VTAVEVGGWNDPGADPPHEWERVRLARVLAGMVQENNDLRAIVRRVREYAQSCSDLADEYRGIDSPYMAVVYDETARALRHTIGDRL